MAKAPLTQSDIDLSQQTIIAQGDPSRSAISFNHILQTGEIPRSPDLSDNQKFNWGPDGGDYTQPPYDSLTQAIADVREAVKEAIANDPEMQALLQDENWSEGDRAAWEKGLSEIVARELDKIPGLDQYTVKDGTGNKYAEDRTTVFNNISTDLDNGTNKWEVDCETFSAIKGSIMQMVENETLPKVQNPDPSNLKFAADYFYVTGNVYFGPSSGYGGHAFVMSSVTGNIIEATADPNSPYGTAPYLVTNGTFADFIAGKQLVAADSDDPTDIAIYGQKASAGEEEAKLQARLDAIKRGDYSFLKDQENRFNWDDSDVAKQHYAAMYNQGRSQTLTIPPTTPPEPGEVDPGTLLAQLRQDAPNMFLYENEIHYFKEAYLAFLENNKDIQNGASIVFKSERDRYDILVTQLPNGEFEFKDITDMDAPPLPTVEYKNLHQIPPVPRPPAREPDEPAPQMPYSPAPIAPSPAEPVAPEPAEPIEPAPAEPAPEIPSLADPAPAIPSPVEAPIDKGQHTVKRGDNLWKIAKQHYKDEIAELQETGKTRNQAIQEIVEEIAKANGLGNGTDANTIHPGQSIELPNIGNDLSASLNWGALDKQTAQRHASLPRDDAFDGDRFEAHFRTAIVNGPGHLTDSFAVAHNQGLAHPSAEQIVEALLGNNGQAFNSHTR